MTSESIAHAFLESLHPLLRQLETGRALSPGKIGVLRHLAGKGRATSAQLATAVHVSPQGISLAVRELERLELVVKVPDPADRRRWWIEATEAGRQRLALESASSREWLAHAVENVLSADEREILAAAVPVLRKLGTDLPDA